MLDRNGSYMYSRIMSVFSRLLGIIYITGYMYMYPATHPPLPPQKEDGSLTVSETD